MSNYRGITPAVSPTCLLFRKKSKNLLNLKCCFQIFLASSLFLATTPAFSQDTVVRTIPPAKDSIVTSKYGWFKLDPRNQSDIKDIGSSIFKRRGIKSPVNYEHIPGKLHISPLVAPTYTLQTGFGALVGAELAFYTDSSAAEDISSILTSVNYTQYEQTVFPIEASIWTRDNRYNIQTDWRYLNYPSMTYGLGGSSTLAEGYFIDYHYLRLHQGIFRRIAKSTYMGIGYDYDRYWDIQELNAAGQDSTGQKTDYDHYGFSKTATASGISIGLLYDSRKNSINPDQGSYLNVSFRPKFVFLGSDNDWQSLLVEYKHYQKFPAGSDNVIAIWNYDWLTISGNPPYLLLPSTGWDTYWNTGRGYIQGRFRSKNMVYLESEYRFAIMPNGLIGGVVFVNAESFSEKNSSRFQQIAPGYGVGLRLKLDKFSKTNFCIDYGIGQPGNRGFALNIGEVF